MNNNSDHDKKTFSAPNQSLVESIVSSLVEIFEEDPTLERTLIIYELTKTVIKSLSLGNIKPILFAYYLAVYREYYITVEKSDKSETDLYNSAALSLLNLYRTIPKDRVLCSLARQSVSALTSVLMDRHVNNPDNDQKEVVVGMSAIVIMNLSTKKYFTPGNINKNDAYIGFIIKIFSCAISNDDLTFLVEDKTLRSVIDQIRARKRVISVFDQ